MNLKRAILNFKSLSIPTQWEMTKAKRAYKKEHPVCAVCGVQKDLEVHHIIPVHVDKTKALDPKNFITLCDWRNHGCHYVWGHFRNFRTKWNPRIREFASLVRTHTYKTRGDIILEMEAVNAWNASRKSRHS